MRHRPHRRRPNPFKFQSEREQFAIPLLAIRLDACYHPIQHVRHPSRFFDADPRTDRGADSDAHCDRSTQDRGEVGGASGLRPGTAHESADRGEGVRGVGEGWRLDAGSLGRHDRDRGGKRDLSGTDAGDGANAASPRGRGGRRGGVDRRRGLVDCGTRACGLQGSADSAGSYVAGDQECHT